MHPLRTRFIDELRLRGLSRNTIDNYVTAVSHLSRHYNRSPLTITAEQVRAYLLFLVTQRALAPSTVNLHICSLKSFYALMCPGSTVMEGVSKVKQPKQLPEVLSREEVERLLACTVNVKHQAIIALLYSSGIRLMECARLKLTHIDSGRMKVRVEHGKGGKDRYTILSHRSLELLRAYARGYRPRLWLFEGHHAGKPLSVRAFGKVVGDAARRAGISKRVSPHTLRHTFATHLLEAGTTLPVIQKLLGHSKISTTMIYLHLGSATLDRVVSPLDRERVVSTHDARRREVFDA